MKMLRNILLILLALLVVSAVGGYFFMKQKFTPAPSEVTVTGLPVSGDLRWYADTVWRPAVPHAALLVPVTVPGYPRTCYLQFDTGSPYTRLYSRPLTALVAAYPALQSALQVKDNYVQNFQCTLGSGQLTLGRIKVLEHGASALPADSSAFIIGTLGTDVLEGRVLVLDYAQRRFTLDTHVAEGLTRRAAFAPLAFDNRRVIVNADLEGHTKQLLFDSGSSAYALLTNKDNWQKLAVPQAPEHTSGSNYLGKKLVVHTVPTAAQLRFGAADVPLRTVTYVEGITMAEEMMMRFSGMEGMLGNEPFATSTLILDVQRGRFGLVR
ncbi:hypothetical protein [Hymenobacter sp. CRA2]|uniref:hypothetical protein n=1 Tax=Hymenobacter sp. CRA2 TaxID=1955620 RepID=UPI00098F78F9|nr:hypothetical protein [Hymenobacter sp. CRA2]OON70053.1 hypothetical protein B0919_04715 [Hymenobacter sp. CRA2]